ncbi:Crp/Fnr family transcriptional regulator [Niabella drilacis]|uniref:cAMP-binding domain of CRP or a regulatory subunit of cAMP-dependent protein kinases n=1 Tax=Niabella drilacis (strain DSM 25811 / CCM 8410 / CCUG 62505 / LMG 26954 / E90) TaxID=1285928 RepID=A0A1G6VU16_NIADE|nr:Crp/Fnr family transcriptional regulator [Niabella drilacis]SDD57112.1 cAMP-binding domain of CRP or a regulatory subunit of cAMP-dependent protein kinases [Niabella drilacis]
MDRLLHYFRSLVPFSDESWHRLQPALSKAHFEKGAPLLKEGQACRALYFIEKGYCRTYYQADGLEKNTGFFFENDMVTNISSFGSGQPSAYFIAAGEPLDVIVFDRSLLQVASKTSPEIEALGRSCIRLFAARQEDFASIFQLYTAKNRLEYLERHYPFMLQRIPLSQLSSFLGVARETLSRIRSRRRAGDAGIL